MHLWDPFTNTRRLPHPWIWVLERLQAITEARNVSIPCTKDSDCGSPKCKCNGPVGGRGLCVCSGDVAGLFEQAMTKTPKVQNEVP
ncbi:hypothetical protein SLEP1_g31633 [Rubroshorea leprosula]|uniref:Uncharacterized protein n=1 Tax=Rubroshorea leprosula TaxID=152421 RepID=A0AAV5KA48_9ROSI|nr:hypothetical protein SLEP1_g31633 [Rubroshorea leprosula]